MIKAFSVDIMVIAKCSLRFVKVIQLILILCTIVIYFRIIVLVDDQACLYIEKKLKLLVINSFSCYKYFPQSHTEP